jgi:hypothetical protein
MNWHTGILKGCLAATALACGACGGVPQTLLEEGSGPHLEMIVRVDVDTFQRPRLREFSAAFSERIARQFVTGTLWIVTSAADSERVQGVRVTDYMYPAWRRDWLRENRTPFPVARVSVTRAGARLDVRMGDGSIAAEVIRGRDPLVLVSERQRFELLYLLVRELRGIRGEGPIEGYEYQVVMRPLEPSSRQLDEGVLLSLSRDLGASRIEAQLQMNEWVRHANLPVVFPFRQTGPPPKTFKEAVPYEAWCSFAEGRADCQSNP